MLPFISQLRRKWRLDLNSVTHWTKRVTATRRTAEPNSASCLDRIDGAAKQAQGIGAKRETAHRKPMRRAVLVSSRARGFEPPISKCVVCQTLFLVSKTARKNQEQSLTPSLSRTKNKV